MDTTTRDGRLKSRARRALVLIAAAVLVTAGASVAYLQPSLLKLPAPPKAVGPALLSNDYSATYSFLTPSLGWALVADTTAATRHYSVFRTTDAAKHWKRQFIRPLNVDLSLPSFMARFFDPSHGLIVVGNPAEIYRTSDGGTHWAQVKTPSYAYSSFVPADVLHGWLLGLTGPPDPAFDLLSTSDGGDTWTALPQALIFANGSAGFGPRAAPVRAATTNLSFRNPREGWVGASAAEPTVYSSGDGGATWQPRALPNDLVSNLCGEQVQLVTGVSLLPARGVVAILADPCGPGYGYASFDGGMTWRLLASPPGTTSWGDFAYQDSSHWWAMGSGDLWKSSDAGLSWKLVSQQIDGWQYIPHVIDANHAWAELVNGPEPKLGAGLAVTSDGGLHWSQVNAPQPG